MQLLDSFLNVFLLCPSENLLPKTFLYACTVNNSSNSLAVLRFITFLLGNKSVASIASISLHRLFMSCVE